MAYRASILFLFIMLAAPAIGQDLYSSPNEKLRQQWDLIEDSTKQHNIFKVRQYKPLYVLFANYSNNVNTMPSSPSPGHQVTTPLPLQNVEMKFQISFKTKVLNNIFGSEQSGDLWIAYSQTSRWQVYNAAVSRPFRETNYEPELMYIIPTRYRLFGLNGVYAGIGFSHQSNGRSNPLSRSWNRVILQFAWESEHMSIVLKPWWRLQEAVDKDDNPGIENYLGRTELLLAFNKGIHHFDLIGRHSLRFDANNRGSIQFDYAINVFYNLKLYLQAFHGYGESMIDYNHQQTTIGLGFSLTEWR